MNSVEASPFSANEISEWFWDIILRAARSKLKLRSILEGLTREEIYKFQDEFLDARTELTDETFVIHIDPDESEDGTADIADWVVSQGKEYIEMFPQSSKTTLLMTRKNLTRTRRTPITIEIG